MGERARSGARHNYHERMVFDVALAGSSARAAGILWSARTRREALKGGKRAFRSKREADPREGARPPPPS